MKGLTIKSIPTKSIIKEDQIMKAGEINDKSLLFKDQTSHIQELKLKDSKKEPLSIRQEEITKVIKVIEIQYHQGEMNITEGNMNREEIIILREVDIKEADTMKEGMKNGEINIRVVVDQYQVLKIMSSIKESKVHQGIINRDNQVILWKRVK